MFIAALLMSAAVPQDATTIIIDQREHCGVGRVAEFYQKRAEREAREIRRKLEAEGKTVRVVKAYPGTKLGEYGEAVIMNPAC